MSAEANIVLTSGLGAALFAAVFLFGGKVYLLGSVIRDPPSLASAGAGLSTAYVFIHLMPELAEARNAFAESSAVELRYEGMVIYVVALAAFVAFYGIEHFRGRLRDEAPDGEGGGPSFRLQMAGWAAYSVVAAYLLAHGLGETSVRSTVLYAVAIAFHLLAAVHSFRREHRAAYDRTGRLVLAGAVVVGWLLSLLGGMPLTAIAAAVAFVSGAVIVNSAIMELPSEKDGRFLAFAAGAALYTLILIPLG